MSTEITHDWRSEALAGPRSCLQAQGDVIVDHYGHCMSCGFEVFSHEPLS